MHAAVYKGASVVAVESLPVPEIGPGEVLIRVESCGICPTDLKKIAYNLLPGPRIYGHETAGVIAAVGTVQPPLEFTASGDEAQDIQALTAAITLRIEEMVRAAPGQWLWIHNRWLTPRDIALMQG